MTENFYKTLVKTYELPFGQICHAVDEKTARAILYLATRITEEVSDQWGMQAEKIREKHAKAGRMKIHQKDRFEYSSLLDGVYHGRRGASSSREFQAQIMEMREIAPWPDMQKEDV